MGAYILRRLLLAVPVLLGVTLLTFLIAKVTPGDPVRIMLGPQATGEQIARARAELGLDDPVHVQFGRYVWGALRGDLGLSIRGRRPVLDEILARFPSTFQLTMAAMSFAVTFGLASGLLAAVRARTWADSLVRGGSMLGLSVPDYWLGILFVLLFGVRLGWVSVTGGDGLRNLILPALALGLAPAAVLARLTRSSMLEVLRDDYVRTARAKGLRERAVVIGHALRNALLPVVTVLGLQFAALLGGAVFIEAVFARPGLGRYAVAAVAARDYPVVQGTVLFLALVYVAVNLLIDLLYAALDPRIRYS
jgi:peptide/nickel transport system permease protein